MRIRDLREDNNLTQEDIANYLKQKYKQESLERYYYDLNLFAFH